MSEFEKDLGKKKEGTDTLNQNQENSTKPAVPAEGENNAPAAPAKKKFAAVYRPQNSTQKRPAGNRTPVSYTHLALKDYHGNLLLVGINYDKSTKKHECVIESMKK